MHPGFPCFSYAANAGGMLTKRTDDLTTLVRDVLANAPVWARTELSSKDTNARERAEEVLAAMIVADILKQAD